MCSVPVTLGGGMTTEKGSFPAALRLKVPLLLPVGVPFLFDLFGIVRLGQLSRLSRLLERSTSLRLLLVV